MIIPEGRHHRNSVSVRRLLVSKLYLSQSSPCCRAKSFFHQSCKHPKTGGSERKEENPMSLRKQAKILGISPTYLSLILSGRRSWRGNLKERYEELVNTFVNTREANTAVINGLTISGEEWLRDTVGRFLRWLPVPLPQANRDHIVRFLGFYDTQAPALLLTVT